MYGIPNCDTIKKARTWLGEQGVEFTFHNYKKDGISADLLRDWAGVVGWEKLLNKAGTTFRKLDEGQKTGIDEAKAIALMVENPSMIKRPVLITEGQVTVGFKPGLYADVFASHN